MTPKGIQLCSPKHGVKELGEWLQLLQLLSYHWHCHDETVHSYRYWRQAQVSVVLTRIWLTQLDEDLKMAAKDRVIASKSLVSFLMGLGGVRVRIELHNDISAVGVLDQSDSQMKWVVQSGSSIVPFPLRSSSYSQFVLPVYCSISLSNAQVWRPNRAKVPGVGRSQEVSCCTRDILFTCTVNHVSTAVNLVTYVLFTVWTHWILWGIFCAGNQNSLHSCECSNGTLNSS